jgi:hypothetical protein
MKMFGPLGKFWSASKRHPLAVLLAGLVVGVPIGWFLGSRSTVEQSAISPAKATTYTRLSSVELKNKSAQLVTAIRGLARSYYDEDRRLRRLADENSGKTDSHAERERLRNAWLAESAKLHDMFLDRYNTDFWADAVLLRQAIVAKVGAAPGAQDPILFQHPTNILGIVQVANNLELLGKSLPANEQSKP